MQRSKVQRVNVPQTNLNPNPSLRSFTFNAFWLFGLHNFPPFSTQWRQNRGGGPGPWPPPTSRSIHFGSQFLPRIALSTSLWRIDDRFNWLFIGNVRKDDNSLFLSVRSALVPTHLVCDFSPQGGGPHPISPSAPSAFDVDFKIATAASVFTAHVCAPHQIAISCYSEITAHVDCSHKSRLKAKLQLLHHDLSCTCWTKRRSTRSRPTYDIFSCQRVAGLLSAFDLLWICRATSCTTNTQRIAVSRVCT